MALPIVRSAERMRGSVKWFSDQRGFGFITPDTGGDDVFLSYKMLPEAGFRTVRAGQRVSFVRGRDDLGPAALDVELEWDDETVPGVVS
jgi:cold shock CspA family protein